MRFLAITGLFATLLCGTALAQPLGGRPSFNWQDHILDAHQQSAPFRAGGGNAIDKQRYENELLRGKCKATHERPLPADATSSSSVLIIGYSGQCSWAGAVVISIWQKTTENTYDYKSAWTLSAADIGVDVTGPTEGVSNARYMETVNVRLKNAISLDPFPSGRLPVWTQGKVIPTLPLGLTWSGGAERELYEAIRAGNYQVYCVYGFQIKCAAEVPDRPGAMIDVLSADGLFDIYGVRETRPAIALLTGETPAMTATQVAAAKAAKSEKEKQDLGRALRSLPADPST
jgi:hypothetical protein